MAHTLGSFGKEMNRRSKRVSEEVKRAMRTVAIDFVTDVAQQTPILTGQAQANWITSIGFPASYYFPILGEGTGAGWQDSVAIAKGVLARGFRHDTEIHITNNVPYIVQLNRGSSKQAPALFVQASVLRAQYKLNTFKLSWT